MQQKVLKIRELDLQSIRPLSADDDSGSRIVVIGKPGSGKSYLIRDLIYSKRHIFPVAKIISGTEESNKFFQSIFKKLYIHDELNEGVIKEFIKRQKIAKEYIGRWAWGMLICDDCMDDPSIFRKPVFGSLMKNGRHWNLWFILGMQYAMDIWPAFRICIDGTFIFREPNPAIRKKLYENYAGIVGDYALFCKLLDEITDDHTALYIDNRSQSNRVEDCVFWYKARERGQYEFGCEDYRLFHEVRYDPEHSKAF